jgi:hypothetical protein
LKEPRSDPEASSLCVTVREARAATRLALDVHKGQRLPWVDHHRVRPRRARASEPDTKVTFKDVAGVDEAKFELQEVST